MVFYLDMKGSLQMDGQNNWSLLDEKPLLGFDQATTLAFDPNALILYHTFSFWIDL